MKKISFLAIIAFIVATISVHAQENSLLWKISGNGLKKDSYLLGTLHMMCEEDYSLKDKIKNLIPLVDVLTLEVNIGSEENKAIIPEMMKPDTTFLKGLTPAELAKVDSILTSQQLSIRMLDMMSPAVFVSILSLKTLNCSDPRNIKTMEVDLQSMATAAGKRIDDLETLKFQMDMLNKMFQASDLVTYLNMMDDMPAISKKMVTAYQAENLKDLETIIYDNSYLSKEEQADFLTKRNHDWITKMPSKMQESSNLFAVGAGHLVGDKGLIKLLSAKGYKLTPIF
ncbi:TraB/GumN family protein [Sphingobacterium faecium]|uniref:TraB/GumN family protein n=1 Tax=Sphingobacterium faecium TaxID=34087 RepID=UPI00246958A5|nr:TraB/GumN family protein [Sphingobacterium faecium]MDH5826471.1 TraB/GumN family protein [Sphingobacterium faecium]